MANSETLAQEVKAFGIRVAIAEPGIIDTDVARSISTESERSLYPHGHRMADLFTHRLKTPVGPELVGDKIREIVESDSWQLRYPVGPNAEATLERRAAMTDEEWVDWWAADDEEWYARSEL